MRALIRFLTAPRCDLEPVYLCDDDAMVALAIVAILLAYSGVI